MTHDFQPIDQVAARLVAKCGAAPPRRLNLSLTQTERRPVNSPLRLVLIVAKARMRMRRRGALA